MHLLALVALLLFTANPVDNRQAKHTQQEAPTPQQQPQRAETAPAVQEIHAQYESANTYDPRNDCLYRIYLFSTVLGVIGGIVGVGLIFWQVNLLKQTVDASTEQSKKMELHIGEAARSADATENVVNTIKTGNRAIIRAYLTVTIGGAVFQERRPGLNDFKFEAKPHLVNTGNTPARKVRIRKKAAILPAPLPEGFDFPLPDESNEGDATVGAHLSYVIGSMVEDFVPDAEVPAIKEGIGKCLVTWGLITYEDVFGESHSTKFAQSLIFLPPNNAVYGIYIPGQNDAD